MIENIINKLWNKYYKDIFLIYSFLSTGGFKILDILPHFIRNIFFRAMLGKMGKGVTIDYTVYLRYLKNIEIGSNVTINRGCQFYTSVNMGKKIVIGDNVKISPNAKFYGAAHDHTKPGMPDTADDIFIEDEAWICADTTILQGVTIGKGSVIAAASVVTRDIPPYTLAAGNPARVIKNREQHVDIS